MKRYRLMALDFDRSPLDLAEEIPDDWEERLKEQHRRTQANIRAWLVHTFGAADAERKCADYVELGPSPMSVLAFHNHFYGDARAAFTLGAYYPALVAACALGERMLNHLVRVLAPDYPADTRIQRLASQRSADWKNMVATLERLQVMVPKAAEAFLELYERRNAALHFDPAVDREPRRFALEALRCLAAIIDAEFSALGSQPWFIDNPNGFSFIKHDWEGNPFVKRVLLPQAMYVGPYHALHLDVERGGWSVSDDYDYGDEELTDEEFMKRFRAGPPR
jgi:hypothetical protein